MEENEGGFGSKRVKETGKVWIQKVTWDGSGAKEKGKREDSGPMVRWKVGKVRVQRE